MQDEHARKCDRAACGKEYTPAKYWQRYCSKACRNAHRKEAEKVGKAVLAATA